MAKDARGWRAKFAVVAPSTNTIVQPDMDDFRVSGVTNHFGRIAVPDMKVCNDDEFVALVEAIGATFYDAVYRFGVQFRAINRNGENPWNYNILN